MGLKFLSGKTWAEVTREERFFCQRLFGCIEKMGASRFIALINKKYGTAIDENVDWEPGYEVCFYRDLKYLRGSGPGYPQKRTFDLCFLSDHTIVIVEAKAQQGFHERQLKEIRFDKTRISKLSGIPKEQIHLVGLVSSLYKMKDSTRNYFEAVLTWKDLSGLFGADAVLSRADSVYGK